MFSGFIKFNNHVFVNLILLTTSLFLISCAPTGRYADKHDSAPVRPPTLTEQQDPEVLLEPVGRGNLPYEVFGKKYTPMRDRKPFIQRGTASWYGKKFHGHLTSNGEVYNMFGMSAAHKTLPLPSYVKVTNLKNNKSAIVRVNDRGPFHQDRIIDLSYAAAFKIGVYDTGTADVKVEVILPGNLSDDLKDTLNDKIVAQTPAKKNLYQVILAGFSTNTEAEESLKGLSIMLDSDAKLDTSDEKHKLVFGPFKEKQLADELVQKIRQFGYQTVNLESLLAP